MNKQETVQAIIEGLIEKMGFSVTAVKVVMTEAPQESFYCSLQVVDGQNFLIGQYGMNLAALQHLVRILVRKKFEEKLEIIVDINDYFLEKKQLLEREAEQAMEAVLQNNVSITLRPMLPYERKIVHAFLSLNEGIVTESIGLGDARRVMVHPKTPLVE